MFSHIQDPQEREIMYVGDCAFCKDGIEVGERYIANVEGVKLHTNCLNDYIYGYISDKSTEELMKEFEFEYEIEEF